VGHQRAATCLPPLCLARGVSSPHCGFPNQGSDARDSLLGRLFGCAAVIRSGRVADAEVAACIAARLLAVAAAKSFLREAATAVLLELLKGAPDAVTAAVLADSPELRGVLQASPSESDPEVIEGLRVVRRAAICGTACFRAGFLRQRYTDWKVGMHN